MPNITIEDPSTGNSWTVTSPNEETALRDFNAARGDLGIPAEVQIRVRPPEAASDAAIQTNEQGNSNVQESPNFPEMNQPGEPAGYDMLRVGRNEAGMEKTKNFTTKDWMDALGNALGSSNIDQFSLGMAPAIEKNYRNQHPDTQGKSLDEMLQESSDIFGPLPTMAMGLPGAVAGLGNLLPESWLMRGGGASGAAARTAAAPVDTAVVQQLDSAARDETSSPVEGTGTALGLQLLGEALTKGAHAGGKRFAEKGMTQLEKSERKMTPTVMGWLKNVPYGPSPIPDASILDQIGEAAIPVVKSGEGTQGFRNLKQDAQMRRQGELERAQKKGQEITGKTPLDTAEGQARGYKEQRLDPNISSGYTDALKAPFPNTSVQTKTGKMIVPIPLKDTLTSSPRFYEAWVKAGEGTDGGLANAEIQAKKRGTTPTKAEIAWHTIQKLEGGGQAEQELAALLKKDMGNVNKDLKGLTEKQFGFGQQERGAQLGNKIYDDPGHLDKATHQVLKDPAAMKAAGDAFVARFVEASSKGDLPKLTQQMRATAGQLLGEQRASDLFRHYDVEVRTRAIDDPLRKTKPGVSTESIEPKTGYTRRLMRAGARVLSGAAGGPHSAIASLGPAAAQFLRDNKKGLSSEDWEGLLSLLRKSQLQEPSFNRFEKMGTPPTATAGALSITNDARRERRRHKGQE